MQEIAQHGNINETDLIHNIISGLWDESSAEAVLNIVQIFLVLKYTRRIIYCMSIIQPHHRKQMLCMQYAYMYIWTER